MKSLKVAEAVKVSDTEYRLDDIVVGTANATSLLHIYKSTGASEVLINFITWLEVKLQLAPYSISYVKSNYFKFYTDGIIDIDMENYGGRYVPNIFYPSGEVASTLKLKGFTCLRCNAYQK